MDSFRNCFVFDWLTARRITRQRQAMKPDRREGFMGGDGRVHPHVSRRLASGWPERSGGIRRADRRDASRHAYRWSSPAADSYQPHLTGKTASNYQNIAIAPRLGGRVQQLVVNI